MQKSLLLIFPPNTWTNLLQRALDDTTRVLDEERPFFNSQSRFICRGFVQSASPIDGDYQAGEMHPVSTSRATNDGGESNCESDGGWDTLDSRMPIKQNLNAWNSDVYSLRLLCKWKSDHPVKVVTMTTPHLQHFTWKWKTDMCRVMQRLESHSPVEIQCGLLFFFWAGCVHLFLPQREVQHLGLSPASFWPLMDLKLISLLTGCVGFLTVDRCLIQCENVMLYVELKLVVLGNLILGLHWLIVWVMLY